jgi:hypothetical protein
MCSHRVLLHWAILAAVCTAAMFFFPAPQGSFTAIHGPMTALRAWQFAVTTFAGIAFAAAVVLPTRRFALLLTFCFSRTEFIIASTLSFGFASILRC